MTGSRTSRLLWSISLLLAFPSFGAAVVDKWIPANFNWSAVDPGPPKSWNGLYMNLSGPSVTVSKDLVTVGTEETTALVDIRTLPNGNVAVAIPWFFRFGWQLANGAITGSGLVSACKQDKGKPKSTFFCVTGIIGSVIGVGGHASAAKAYVKKKGWFAKASDIWLQSGLDLIELEEFGRKRGLGAITNTTSQYAHNHIVHQAIRSIAGDDVEFAGYAPSSHKVMQ